MVCLLLCTLQDENWEKIPGKVRHLFSKFQEYKQAVVDLGLTACHKCKQLIKDAFCKCSNGPFLEVKYSDTAWWNYWLTEPAPSSANMPFIISVIDYFVNTYYLETEVGITFDEVGYITNKIVRKDIYKIIELTNTID